MRTRFMYLVALGVVAGCSMTTARATVYEVPVSGTLQGHAFTATLDLDVTNGQATSGSGMFTGFGFDNVNLVLITVATPGNEGGNGGANPVGFRANDGTDYNGANQNYPIDSVGLLFDVGTAVAQQGMFPLLSLGTGDNETAFSGVVNGQDFYNQVGTADIGPGVVVSGVPEPSTWAMMLLGLAGLGFLGRRKARSGSPVVAIAAGTTGSRA